MRIHDDATRRLRRAELVARALLIGGLLCGIGYLLVDRVSCPNQHWLLQFAGSDARLTAQGWDCDTPYRGLLAQSAFAAVYGVTLAWLIYVLWPKRIHIKPLQTLHGDSQAKALSAVPILAAIFDLVENGFSALALATAPADHVVSDWIAWVPVFAWTKWLLLAATYLALIGITLAWLALAMKRPWTRVLDAIAGLRAQLVSRLFGLRGTSRRRAILEQAFGLSRPDVARLQGDRVDGSALGGTLGICCSGGGIRSAAFNLGALGALEEARVRPGPSAPAETSPDDPVRVDPMDSGVHGLLGEARYLASVSGGGYAATAWRVAAGTDRLPARRVIGSPYEDRSGEIRYPNSIVHGRPQYLIQHVRRYRHFLKNGRGGLAWSLTRAVGRMALHAGLVLGAVFAVGWPVGRLAGSWAVADAPPPDGFFTEGWDYRVFDHHWFTIRLVATVAAIVFSARLFTRRTMRRRQYDQAMLALLGLLGFLSVALVIVPWVLAEVVPRVSDGRAWQLSGAYASGLGVVWGLARSRLGPRAKYLGGVLLALLLLGLGAGVAADASAPDRFFGMSAGSYLVILGVLAVFSVLSNPDAWSLHGLYRRKLAETFAARIVQDPATGESTIVPLPYSGEPMLDNYRAPHTEGPQSIICCAAARVETTTTGIAALSMTFAPGDVTVHGLIPSQNDAADDRQEHWERGAARYRMRLTRQRIDKKSGTLSGLAAVSGAAVAPSMGRLNLQSTNALLAALNIRLGVWLPNPATDISEDMAPRLLNMFKELLAWYDTNEEVVYVTDGGHWENLGLVELIRRSDPACDYIICIDVSGDAPGSLTTLREAIKLARLELDVQVFFPDAEWAAMSLATGSAQRNFAAGTVTRPTGAAATLLYIKAAIAETTPLDIQRFCSEDPKFPNYSTGDQFLTDREFVHLSQLGYHTTWTALCHPAATDVFGAELAERIAESAPTGLQVHPPATPASVEIDLTRSEAERAAR